MYKTCPKCNYKRSERDHEAEGICPGCGLIYAKWLKNRFRDEVQDPPANQTATPSDTPLRHWFGQVKEATRYVESPVDPVIFYSHALLYLIFFVWGWNFIFMEYATYHNGVRIDHPFPEIGDSFLHLINLVFHEAGHILFSPFGRFLTVLGGTLMQLLVPLVVTGTFLLKEVNPFAASLGLWWTAQSLMDIAPYINDARNGQLILLGGTTGAETTGYHDWETLLTMMDLMEYDHAIADTVNAFGVLLMLLAFYWGGFILYKKFRILHR